MAMEEVRMSEFIMTWQRKAEAPQSGAGPTRLLILARDDGEGTDYHGAARFRFRRHSQGGTGT